MTTGLDSFWPHFSRLPTVADKDWQVMVRGEGTSLFDNNGKRFFDALSALYCVNVGHGRREIGEAMARQATTLGYYPAWGKATPPVLELAERVVSLAPEWITRVFFTSGGSDSVDAAWKLSRQYHRLRGNPGKTKIVARQGAYHGTTLGALSVTGVPSLREPFEPLVPGAVHVPKVDPFHSDRPALEHSLERAEDVAKAIEREGPDTVAAIIIEPIQNAGGCLVAEPEYFTRLREIADTNDLLLISDETICSWGRLGTYFGCQEFGYRPDVITTAKGLTSGYAPMGGLLAAESVAEVFAGAESYFNHGLTFGGHPIASAAALANLDIMRDENLVEQARTTGQAFHRALQNLREIPLVGDVRGRGMFYAVELVRDSGTGVALSDEDRASLVKFIPDALYEAGVICRAMHRGGPVLQFAPPLIATPSELTELTDTVGTVLRRALALIS